MASADQILSEFIDAWNAGERPSVTEYTERAPEGERDALAGQISEFLEWAPQPKYSPDALAAIQAEPAVQEATKLIGSPAGLWPSLLPRLRNAARLTRDQVVSRLTEGLGLAGKEERVKAYYHQMESGTLEPQGVSRRVLETLGRVLGVSERELEEAGEFGRPVAAAGGLYLRAEMTEEVGLESPNLASAPQSPGEWDEVDQLFRGGR